MDYVLVYMSAALQQWLRIMQNPWIEVCGHTGTSLCATSDLCSRKIPWTWLGCCEDLKVVSSICWLVYKQKRVYRLGS